MFSYVQYQRLASKPRCLRQMPALDAALKNPDFFVKGTAQQLDERERACRNELRRRANAGGLNADEIGLFQKCCTEPVDIQPDGQALIDVLLETAGRAPVIVQA